MPRTRAVKGQRLAAALVFAVVCFRHIGAGADSLFSADARTLVAKSAVAVLTDEFFGGRTKALKILFTREPLTEQQRRDAAVDDGRALMKKDYAFLVLFIDMENRVWQVNLTVVFPGLTVVRTIAWKPDDLRSFASGYAYDGKRLTLKSKGTLTEATPGQAPIALGWDVDIDAPVAERPSSGKK